MSKSVRRTLASLNYLKAPTMTVTKVYERKLVPCYTKRVKAALAAVDLAKKAEDLMCAHHHAMLRKDYESSDIMPDIIYEVVRGVSYELYQRLDYLYAVVAMDLNPEVASALENLVELWS